jgi:hypothetical protein
VDLISRFHAWHSPNASRVLLYREDFLLWGLALRRRSTPSCLLRPFRLSLIRFLIGSPFVRFGGASRDDTIDFFVVFLIKGMNDQ